MEGSAPSLQNVAEPAQHWSDKAVYEPDQNNRIRTEAKEWGGKEVKGVDGVE
jgi:hypothetical protein